MLCTHHGFKARSRRGRDMSALLPELATMPDGLQLDGDVALSHDGHPDFHSLSNGMLHGEQGVAITYFIFDVVACQGGTTTHLPYKEPGNCSRRSRSTASIGRRPETGGRRVLRLDPLGAPRFTAEGRNANRDARAANGGSRPASYCARFQVPAKTKARMPHLSLPAGLSVS
jgi:hypothetical protein